VLANTFDQIKDNLEFLVEKGKEWRDCKDLNRFRLVIGASEPKKIEKKLNDSFEQLQILDDFVHLHLINIQELIKNEII
jgi:hypothetical protein